MILRIHADLVPRCWELQQQSCWLASFGGMLGQPKHEGIGMLRHLPFWLNDFEADYWICREDRVHKALKAIVLNNF